MRLTRRILRALALLLPACGAVGLAPIQPVPNPWPYPQKLAMVQRDVLTNVDGRLDHMALDPTTKVLYVAAYRNNSLEALHVPDSTTRQSIPDLSEPAGVLFIAESRRVVVGCDGGVHIFKAAADGKLTAERMVPIEGAADNIRYDAAAKRVYVGHAEAIASFDIETGERGPEIKLPGAPEAFILEPGTSRIFINVPSKQTVVVADRATSAVTAEWSLVFSDGKPPAEGEPAALILNIVEANYPMALDEANGRLFVAIRYPARLIVIDTKSGKHVGQVKDISKDADDCWYDATTRRVFVTGGGGPGSISVIQQDSADDYKLEFTTSTASGARTSLLVPEQRKLYVAAPRLGDDQAYIFVYLIGPRAPD
jgi:hypothetical protein